MGKYNETQVWSIVNKTEHPDMSEDERRISAYMPLVQELFPGINYYSISGFSQVMIDYVRPTLTKLFPELIGKSTDNVNKKNIVNIESFLPSKGYEHLDNPKWKKQLETLLK